MGITIYIDNHWKLYETFTLIYIGYAEETFRIVFFNFELGFIV